MGFFNGNVVFRWDKIRELIKIPGWKDKRLRRVRYANLFQFVVNANRDEPVQPLLIFTTFPFLDKHVEIVMVHSCFQNIFRPGIAFVLMENFEYLINFVHFAKYAAKINKSSLFLQNNSKRFSFYGS